MRKFIDRFVHGLKDDTYEWYDFLKKSQFWPREKLDAYQIELFDKMWKHAIINVPYYKGLANKLGLYSIESVDDIKRIPFLTKDIVRDNFDSLQAINICRRRFISSATSGSSGKNFFFYNDAAKSPFAHALLMRRYDFMGVNFLDREIHIWGSHFGKKSLWTKVISNIKNFLRNDVVLSGYNMSENDLYSICDRINKFKPKIIHSYPSILCVLADFIIKNKIDIYSAHVIYIGGEKLYDFQKAKIESVFLAKVYNFYGACDMGNIGISCPFSDKIHIFQENVFFEVVDDSGISIKDGQGDIVVTDLHNYAMPFIRYKIGDRAKISNSSCVCGRNFQLVDEILGRSFEVLEMPNGNRICGTFWTLLLKSKGGIVDFQVVQDSKDKITIFYTVDSKDACKDSDIQYFIDEIHKRSSNSLEIEFKLKDVIDQCKSGKRKFIISKIN